MTRVLITGVSGQDGSYLADRLVADGAEVHGLVRGGDPETAALVERLPGLVLHEADLGDRIGLQAVVRKVAPDALYNLAGISSVAQSWAEPAVTGEVTGVAVAALLEAVAEKKDSRFFQASSAEMFGNPSESPQTELTPIAPTSPYGVAKAYAHRMVGLWRQRGHFATTAILYNHESPRRPETFVTRKITAAAARISLGSPEELELGDLDVERDWGWAPDYVDAMVRAMHHEEPDDYVIATGETHTVREFVEAAFVAAGVDDWQDRVRINPDLIRPAEIVSMRGDSRHAREQLAWKPTVRFDQLVARMVKADLELVRERERS